jgi:hypothetical protein
VPYSRLLMRPQRDRRPDYIVKEKMLTRLDEGRVALVLDDRPQVCAMFRRRGLKVREVPSDVPNREVNELYRMLA